MTPVWKRFVRFIADDGKEYGGEPEDAKVDVGLAMASQQPVLVKVLYKPSALVEEAEFTGEFKKVAKLLSPLSEGEIGTIRCVGMNYLDHVAELKSTPPKVPEIFLKASGSLTGPTDIIYLPKAAPNAVDAEVELAVVIGKTCKNVPADSALDYVLGYTIANDLTARDVQGIISQWGYCKGYDSFCPMGPALVASGALPEGPQKLKLKTMIDGKILQNGKTDDMVFKVAEIIEYLSRGTTLPKGTVILTGTPSGIGHSHKPPLYLKPGIELRVSISEIGTLTNTVVPEE